MYVKHQIQEGESGLYLLKFAPIDMSALGDTTVVAGVSRKQLVVLGYMFISQLAIAVTFKSWRSTKLSGAMDIAALSVVAYAGGLESPAFATASGEGLVMESSLTSRVRGHVTYIEY